MSTKRNTKEGNGQESTDHAAQEVSRAYLRGRRDALDNNDFNAALAKKINVGGAYPGIGDHPIDIVGFPAEGQAVPSELAGIDYDRHLLRQFDHAQSDLGPKNVWRSQTGLDIDGVRTQEQVVHVEVTQSFKSMRSIQGA